ncbi:MAG: glycerol dehydratase reactivase beta/small subunit family protein [Dehalobacterium sp.]
MEQELSQKDALSVVICRELGADANIVTQVEQGVEEEQVPVFLVTGSGSSMDLAGMAAESSLLGIGVGVDQKGVITLSHFRMPPDLPVFQVSAKEKPSVGKIIGINAARLFKGIPFSKFL